MKSYIHLSLINRIVFAIIFFSSAFGVKASEDRAEANREMYQHFENAVTWAQYYQFHGQLFNEEFAIKNQLLQSYVESEEDDEDDTDDEDVIDDGFSEGDDSEATANTEGYDGEPPFWVAVGQALTLEEKLSMENPDALREQTALLPSFSVLMLGDFYNFLTVKMYPLVAHSDLLVFLTANEDGLKLVYATEFSNEGFEIISDNLANFFLIPDETNPLSISFVPNLSEVDPNFFYYLNVIYKANALFQKNHGEEGIVTSESVYEKDIGSSDQFIVYPFDINPNLTHAQITEFLYYLHMGFEDSEALNSLEYRALSPSAGAKQCSTFLK